MNSIDKFFEEIDANRARRARELSEIKAGFAVLNDSYPFRVRSKAVVVLSYSHWEGFYNECVSTYINYLQESKRKVKDITWGMLVGVMTGDLQKLRDRNHSHDATCDFIEGLAGLINADFTHFNSNVVRSRSNLDFQQLRANYRILKFDVEPFLKQRIRIDKELVGWRHGVAHGDDPDLSQSDSRDHVCFTQSLLLTLADQFQNEIMKRAS